MALRRRGAARATLQSVGRSSRLIDPRPSGSGRPGQVRPGRDWESHPLREDLGRTGRGRSPARRAADVRLDGLGSANVVAGAGSSPRRSLRAANGSRSSGRAFRLGSLPGRREEARGRAGPGLRKTERLRRAARHMGPVAAPSGSGARAPDLADEAGGSGSPGALSQGAPRRHARAGGRSLRPLDPATPFVGRGDSARAMGPGGRPADARSADSGSGIQRFARNSCVPELSRPGCGERPGSCPSDGGARGPVPVPTSSGMLWVPYPIGAAPRLHSTRGTASSSREGELAGLAENLGPSLPAFT